MNLDSTLVAASVATFLTVLTLFFGWFRASFSDLSTRIDLHTIIHQRDHKENMRRFEQISVSLAKLGSDNGRLKYESP